MDRGKITELKAAIEREYEAKINRLREEMEDALTSLGKVEQTLFATEAGEGETTVKTSHPPASRSRRTRFPSSIGASKSPNTLTRVRQALDKLEGDFTRKELHEKAQMDGYGDIPWNTFSAIFQKLKKGEITVVTEPQGTQPGVYQKVDRQT